jgi:multidrug efflux pump subunit AcrA (membrane-fusion protein)
VANALTIPPDAVLTSADGASKYVMVIAADSTAHKKNISIGIQSADSVQVLSGLTTSDMVITTGAYGLDENTKVKVGKDPNAKPDEDEKPAAGTPDSGDKPAGKDASDK